MNQNKIEIKIRFAFFHQKEDSLTIFCILDKAATFLVFSILEKMPSTIKSLEYTHRGTLRANL